MAKHMLLTIGKGDATKGAVSFMQSKTEQTCWRAGYLAVVQKRNMDK